MKYKVINFIKTNNWEGLELEDEKERRYYTSGVILWSITENRKNKVSIIDNINLDTFMKHWYENFCNSELIFE